MRGIAISLCLHQRGHRETPFSPSSVTSLDKNRGLIQKANLGSVAWTGWNCEEEPPVSPPHSTTAFSNSLCGPPLLFRALSDSVSW